MRPIQRIYLELTKKTNSKVKVFLGSEFNFLDLGFYITIEGSLRLKATKKENDLVKYILA